jgi:hypothetical protein
MIKLLLVLCFSTLVLSDLQCYDCGPSDGDDCKDPVKKNVKVTNCKDLTVDNRGLRALALSAPTINIEEIDKDYSCITMYFESNEEPDKSGIYRGCVVRQKNETITTCDHIKTQETAGTTKTCSSCTTDKCNTGGAASLIVSTAALIVVVLAVFLVRHEFSSLLLLFGASHFV